MNVTQSKLVMTISEILTDLSQSDINMNQLTKINSAHFLLVKLFQTLSEDKKVNIEA